MPDTNQPKSDNNSPSESQRAELARRRGQAAATINDPQEKQKYIAEQGDKEASGKMNSVTYNRMSEDAAMRGYKRGTHRVPSTGPAVVHKDEAVLNKSQADKFRMYGLAADHLSSPGKDTPAKEIKEIRTRKAKSGGYIHEHHHTHPEHYPMEEHTSPDQDAMVGHMMDHMGEPNPGEEDADSGQSNIESQSA